MLGIGQELPVVITVRMERAVMECLLHRFPIFDKLTGAFAEVELGKALPDVLYGLGRGMEHVCLIKAIVAQLIEHNLICREIIDAVIFTAHPVGRHQEYGFGKLTCMKAVLGITDGADREYDMHIRPTACEIVDGLRQIVHTGIDRQFLFQEQSLG